MDIEEKEAIKWLFNLRATIDESNMLFDENINVKCGKETIEQITIILNLIQKRANELDKKDKIINEIAEMLVKDHEWFYSEFDNYTKQDFIDYFTEKAEGKI